MEDEASYINASGYYCAFHHATIDLLQEYQNEDK